MAKDRLVTPSYCCILAANFLLYFGFYLLMPVLPFYLTEVFHTGNTMVGIALSCYTVAALTIRPFSGYLLDTLARKPLYLISFFIFTTIFAGYLFAGSLTLFIIHADRPRLCVRYGHRIGQYRGNRHHALIAARRRNRILRPDEQHGDGDRPDGRVVPARFLFIPGHLPFGAHVMFAGLDHGFARPDAAEGAGQAGTCLARPLILIKGIPAGIDLLLRLFPTA